MSVASNGASVGGIYRYVFFSKRGPILTLNDFFHVRTERQICFSAEDRAIVRRCTEAVCVALQGAQENLDRLDKESGDGDCGSTHARAAEGERKESSAARRQFPCATRPTACAPFCLQPSPPNSTASCKARSPTSSPNFPRWQRQRWVALQAG